MNCVTRYPIRRARYVPKRSGVRSAARSFQKRLLRMSLGFTYLASEFGVLAFEVCGEFGSAQARDGARRPAASQQERGERQRRADEAQRQLEREHIRRLADAEAARRLDSQAA